MVKIEYLSDAANKLWKLLFSLKKLKFILTGVINTIFSYIIFALLLSLNIQSEYALLFSTIAGVIFNYFSYKGVVFKKKTSGIGFLRHIVTYSIIYFVNLGMLSFVMNYIVINTYLAQLICIPILVLFSWILMNKWVFK